MRRRKRSLAALLRELIRRWAEEILASYAGALNAGQEVSENFHLANESFNVLDWLCQGNGSQCLRVTASTDKSLRRMTSAG